MTKQQIGKIFQKARKKKKFTYYKVAKMVNAEYTQIKNIENNTRGYTVDLLLKVADALDLKITIG